MKRSQVTIFIILGVVIVLAGLLVAYIRSIDTPTPMFGDSKKSEVEAYVSECMQQKAAEAVQLVGMQGGYVETGAGQRALLDPLNSGYLSLYGGKVFIPYWLYQDETGLDSSGMPPLVKTYDGDDSIQSQLEGYMDENILDCLDLSEFEDEGYVIETPSEPVTEVVFTDSRVIFELNYPIILKREDKEQRYEDFSTELDVRLKRIYTLAREILEYESSEVFLERQTSNFISMHSELDQDYLPPMYGGLQFDSCTNMVHWLYPDVEADFREMLTANIPFIKIANTDYDTVTFTAEDTPDEDERKVRQGIMNGMVKSVSDNNYPFIRVDFGYSPDFPLELDLGSRGLLEPNSMDVDILFAKFCLFEYAFYYNTRFPVLVSLVDSKSSIGQEQYMFQFPMMVVLKDNFPRVRYNDVFGTQVEPEEQSYQCAEEQRLSGPVKIKVVDDMGQPVKKARVMYQCGPSVAYTYDENGTIINASRFADRCFMGVTDNRGLLETSFAPCKGGAIVMIEEDSHLGITDLVGDVDEGKPLDLNYTLYRVVEKEIQIGKYFVMPPVLEGMNMENDNPGIVLGANGSVLECNMKSDMTPLQQHESVLIRLRRIDDDNGVMPSQPFALYNPTRVTTLRLAPGRYHVDMLLVRNERYSGEMTILKNSEYRYIPGSIGSSSETIRYPDDNVEIPTTFSGGAEYEWELRPEDLYSTGRIRFFIIDEGAPKFIEHIGRAADDRLVCSSLNWQKVRPQFV